ncbi:MAG: FMN-binding protein, partial [Clostridia bacterium]|nr:FMN-binding protein [Clostridia bacterium]
DTEIQAISGATKTSRGVTNGVNIALKVAEKIVKGGVK